MEINNLAKLTTICVKPGDSSSWSRICGISDGTSVVAAGDGPSWSCRRDSKMLDEFHHSPVLSSSEFGGAESSCSCRCVGSMVVAHNIFDSLLKTISSSSGGSYRRCRAWRNSWDAQGSKMVKCSHKMNAYLVEKHFHYAAKFLVDLRPCL